MRSSIHGTQIEEGIAPYAFRAAHPTAINFFCFWLFQIPLAYVLAQGLAMGPNGVFWAIAASYSLSAVVGIALFRRGRWKSKTV